ncbi:hypothetical protein Peur_051542 [Populus x canadensis]
MILSYPLFLFQYLIWLLKKNWRSGLSSIPMHQHPPQWGGPLHKSTIALFTTEML